MIFLQILYKIRSNSTQYLLQLIQCAAQLSSSLSNSNHSQRACPYRSRGVTMLSLAGASGPHSGESDAGAGAAASVCAGAGGHAGGHGAGGGREGCGRRGGGAPAAAPQPRRRRQARAAGGRGRRRRGGGRAPRSGAAPRGRGRRLRRRGRLGPDRWALPRRSRRGVRVGEPSTVAASGGEPLIIARKQQHCVCDRLEF